MRRPAKVTLEITADEYTWNVLALNGKPIASHTMRRVDEGCFRGTTKGYLSDKLPDDSYDELAEAIEDGNPHAIASALRDF
jgi:hypothetical protein